MAIELRQQLKLSQQLIMTPQLQMAIKLLQLSRLELMDTISQELEENPALEEMQENAPEESTEDRDSVESEPSEEFLTEVTIEEKINEEVDWNNYLDEYNSFGRINYESESREAPRYEAFIASRKSLKDHLLWQLMMSTPSPEEERIGSLIIGNINRDGYLDTPLEELSEVFATSVEDIEDTLFLLQSFDPIGICSRDLKECLLTQIKHLQLEKSRVADIVSNHMNDLQNKNYKAIAKTLKISFEEVLKAVKIIQGLEPRPGREFSDEEPRYIIPDIYVYKHENDFEIILNDDGLPKLRVSSFYKNAIRRGEKVSASAKDYIQEKMRSATWLIKSIHQRQKTIYKVMESILKFQRDFFEMGVSQLKPMILRDVAQDIGMHESTISRVTTNKYAFTPQGLYELKYFFNSSINRVYGEAVASASVQDKIKRIIASENMKKPYSDDKIAAMLKKDNIDIARRTVAKYREIMRILSSSKRKQY